MFWSRLKSKTLVSAEDEVTHCIKKVCIKHVSEQMTSAIASTAPSHTSDTVCKLTTHPACENNAAVIIIWVPRLKQSKSERVSRKNTEYIKSSSAVPVFPQVAMSVDEFVFDPDHCTAQFAYQSVSQSLCNNAATLALQ